MDGNNGHWQQNGNGNRTTGDRSSGSERVTVRWENLSSLRYWFGSLFGALVFTFAVALVAGLLGFGSSATLVQVCFFGYLGIALIAGLVGRRYWCPHCRGMVRAGATACPHCGRDFEA